MEFSLIEIWEKAPVINKVVVGSLLVMSIWSIFVMIERGLTYLRGSRDSYNFVLALRECLKTGQFQTAIASAQQYNKSSVAKVVESGLTAYQHGLEEAPQGGEFDVADSVHRALERVKEREVSNLRKGLGGLATIASIAPFVGLLGTVIGIIGAFDLMAGGGAFDILGPAIAEALYATALGLFVAIPAAMAFNYFTGKVDSIVVDMSDVSSEFVDYVLREGPN